jgi:hypothetical protein
VLIDDQYYFIGSASGENCNCFIHSLRQCLGIIVNENAVRRSLQEEFSDSCCPDCTRTGEKCTRECMKVYSDNYLNTDHWAAVLTAIGRFASTWILRGKCEGPSWSNPVACVVLGSFGEVTFSKTKKRRSICFEVGFCRKVIVFQGF